MYMYVHIRIRDEKLPAGKSTWLEVVVNPATSSEASCASWWGRLGECGCISIFIYIYIIYIHIHIYIMVCICICICICIYTYGNVPLIGDKENMIKGIIRVFRANTFNTSSVPKLVVALRISSFCFEHFTQQLFKINGIRNQ